MFMFVMLTALTTHSFFYLFCLITVNKNGSVKDKGSIVTSVKMLTTVPFHVEMSLLLWGRQRDQSLAANLLEFKRMYKILGHTNIYLREI